MAGKEEYTVTEEVDFNLPFSDRHGDGYYVRETWYQGPLVHRRFGPAVTIRHPGTLVAVREEFVEEGQIHRYGGPAIIERDPETSAIKSLRYIEHGREVMPPRPTPEIDLS